MTIKVRCRTASTVTSSTMALSSTWGPGADRSDRRFRPWNTLILRAGRRHRAARSRRRTRRRTGLGRLSKRSTSGPPVQGTLQTTFPGVLSTVTLGAQAVGVVNVNWHVAADPLGLNFFGLRVRRARRSQSCRSRVLRRCSRWGCSASPAGGRQKDAERAGGACEQRREQRARD